MLGLAPWKQGKGLVCGRDVGLFEGGLPYTYILFCEKYSTSGV